MKTEYSHMYTMLRETDYIFRLMENVCNLVIAHNAQKYFISHVFQVGTW